MPVLTWEARCSGVCSSSFMLPIFTMVAILLASPTCSPAATGRSVDVAVEGSADGGVGEGLLGLGELRAGGFDRGLRAFDTAPGLARAVEGRLVLLAGGIGVGLGGLLLGADLLEVAARDIAGGDEVGETVGVGGGEFGLRLGGFVRGLGGGDLGHLDGVERAIAAVADAGLRLPHGGGSLTELRFRLLDAKLRVAVLELDDDLTLPDERARVHRGRDDAARGDAARCRRIPRRQKRR